MLPIAEVEVVSCVENIEGMVCTREGNYLIFVI
jgi:hypothetical protein